MADHGTPVDGAECLVCMEDITSDNYVEYQISEGSSWAAAGFCETCVKYLLDTQWQKYVDLLANTKCKAEQRRLLDAGPPINIKDKHGFPCPEEHSGEVFALWCMSSAENIPAKLKGSLEGEARQAWWEEQKNFRIADEPDDAEDKDATA